MLEMYFSLIFGHKRLDFPYSPKDIFGSIKNPKVFQNICDQKSN
jgi:hypothetical protein